MGNRFEVGEEQADPRYGHLEGRVDHIDRKVAEHGTMLAQFGARQELQTDTLNQIAKAVNSPKRTDWQLIIMACLAITGLIGGYVEIRRSATADKMSDWIARIEKNETHIDGVLAAVNSNTAHIGGSLRRLDEVEAVAGRNDDRLRGTREDLREASTYIERLRKDADHLDVRLHQLSEAVKKNSERVAAAEVSRRAIGDYVDTLDKFGTRFKEGAK
jgi:ABC-type transporter Mla subunit MlaD